MCNKKYIYILFLEPSFWLVSLAAQIGLSLTQSETLTTFSCDKGQGPYEPVYLNQMTEALLVIMTNYDLGLPCYHDPK